MNYVGKLFSNFKGFYNEINSATLTGAIDVLIIQQEDGSYVSSPFHVRFGKTGVLRSREKLVDIEINGESVDLHMKLGEAGEAFFVQELDIEDQVPAHLATSPLDFDAAQLMEEGIKLLKGDIQDTVRIPGHLTNENSFQTIEECPVLPSTSVKQSGSQTEGLYNWDSKRDDTPPKENLSVIPAQTSSVAQTAVDESTPNAAMIRDESIVSLYYSSADLDSPMVDKLQSCSLEGNTVGNKVDVSVQTEMCGPEIELKAVHTERVRSISEVISSETDHTYAAQKPGEISTGTTATIEDSTTAKSLTPTKGSSLQVKRGVQHRHSDASLLSVVSQGSHASQASADTLASRPNAQSQVKRLQKRRRKQSRMSEGKESGSSNDSIPEGAVFDLELGEDETDNAAGMAMMMGGMGHSVSMPLSEVGGINQFVDKQRLTEEWAKNQFASNLHPWSDADITPITSPVASRPPTPKSDTEFENQKFDTSSSQTLITGLGEDINKYEDIRWDWGQLPQAVTVQETQGEKQEQSKEPGAMNKPPGGLFQFMRKTKKIRHQPDKEGIYLDDLNLEAMHPEVAALYVYGNKSGSENGSHMKHLSVAVDEDTESGRGASLPHSPVSMNSEVTTGLLKPLAQKPDCRMPQLSMSLCGGLKETSCPESAFQEKFQQNLITYEDFCQDPNMINNQNLVIKLNDKYYNHRTAWPILMSYMAFNRPLPEPTIESLVKTHMPKRETSKRRGWFSWGRSPDYEAETEASGSTMEQLQEGSVLMATPSTSPTSSLPSSPTKAPPTSANEDEDESTQQSLSVKRPMVKSQSFSGMDDTMISTSKKYSKSLTLTSEQIEKLHLKEGQNVATYSVTTQYQGTARAEAHVFLWKWDSKIIVSDIDGTITRSDVLGHVLPLVGKDWSQVGITNLYREIERNGYKFLYLSTRPIGQARMTRDYLRSVTQENNLKLPLGPIMLSPNSLIRALHKEVIEKKPEEFKIGCLKNIKALFMNHCPFCAGFGNKVNDAFAYRTVGIPLSRIFIVNPQGELRMEMINNFRSSYTKLREIVDMFFPPILDKDTQTLGKVHPRNFPAADEYSTFTYWREPLPDVTVELDDILSGGKN